MSEFKGQLVAELVDAAAETSARNHADPQSFYTIGVEQQRQPGDETHATAPETSRSLPQLPPRE